MGSSVAVPKRDPPPPKQTAESVLSYNDLYMIIPKIKLGEMVRIGNVDTHMKPYVKKTFPEFEFVDIGVGKLSGLVRQRYIADMEFCCTSFINLYYWLLPNNKKSQSHSYGSILHTCDPNNFDNGDCDIFLFDWCRKKGNMGICTEWIVESFNRHEVGKKTSFDKLSNMFNDICSKDASTEVCNTWLHVLRSKRSDSNDLLIDKILLSQSQDFKNKFMKCSFPSADTEYNALKIAEPRECWDPNCAVENINFMLTKNYDNLGLCQINRCNINVHNLDIDNVSKLHMTCNNKSDSLSMRPVNQTTVVETNISKSFDIKYGLMSVMFIIIVWIIIVIL
ncbi:Entry/fusion complex component [Sea otter poxvirus]|uniref:Entry/fusion complex component n=1 Tax=Sea otter poxvirus TaxID=1416741 RepID=A0A2U9QHM8_9POXV|nr:Entry/fusion complex component [Sea otter poxvirus]AWU47104.1 Entry/fusion complex component [Sea otter poxvirus]